jgi:hypothetical protein
MTAKHAAPNEKGTSTTEVPFGCRGSAARKSDKAHLRRLPVSQFPAELWECRVVDFAWSGRIISTREKTRTDSSRPTRIRVNH